MVIDIHTHIFPPEVVNRREDFFADEPAFKWLYQSPKARLVGPEELLAAMAEEAVDRAVVFGFPWRSRRLCQRQNEVVLEAQARYPRHLIAFACVNALESWAAAEVERALAAGARGVGELAFYQEGLGREIIAALQPLADLCQGYGVPLLLHTNEPVGHNYPGKSPIQPGDIYALVQAFPDLTLILAHWGGRPLFLSTVEKGGGRRDGPGVFRYCGLAVSVPAFDLQGCGGNFGPGEDSVRQRLSVAAAVPLPPGAGSSWHLRG